MRISVIFCPSDLFIQYFIVTVIVKKIPYGYIYIFFIPVKYRGCLEYVIATNIQIVS